MPDEKVRIGIVGAGGMANCVHIPSLSEIEGVEVVAICDLDLEKAKATAEKFSIPNVHRFYGFYNETLEFISSVKEGRKPSCDINDGLKALELTEFILDSKI